MPQFWTNPSKKKTHNFHWFCSFFGGFPSKLLTVASTFGFSITVFLLTVFHLTDPFRIIAHILAEVPQRPVLGSAATAGLRLAGAAAGAAERAAAGGGTWIDRVDGCAEQFLPLGDAQLIPMNPMDHFRVSMLMEVPQVTMAVKTRSHGLIFFGWFGVAVVLLQEPQHGFFATKTFGIHHSEHLGLTNTNWRT